MIYSGDLIKINGKVIPAITNYKVGRNKLWKDADRNMAGDVRATLIGIFPKIELSIGYITQEEMAQLCELLDQSYFNVEYFDVRVQGTTTAKYYAGDYAIEIFDKSKGLYKPFTVSLVPVSKRRY
jgi:hypothetical protein